MTTTRSGDKTDSPAAFNRRRVRVHVQRPRVTNIELREDLSCHSHGDPGGRPIAEIKLVKGELVLHRGLFGGAVVIKGRGGSAYCALLRRWDGFESWMEAVAGVRYS
jgi:hypothetical protein